MKVLDIAAAMGIATTPLPKGTGVRGQPGPKFHSNDFITPKGWLQIDSSPTTDAVLAGRRGSDPLDVCVFYDPDKPSATLADPILHEVCHAVCGKPGFTDESALLALQWALMQELEGDEYEQARAEFATYGLPGNSCGDDDDFIGSGPGFLRSRAWEACVREAIEYDLILPDGRVVWGRGLMIGAVTKVPSVWEGREAFLHVTA